MVGRGRVRRGGRAEVSDLPGRCVAYFSAEFALHQSLPIYAGGLGVLAGDICKEASDLGMPFVGVGFMYPQGYFHQQVTADGWQTENYEQIDWETAPIAPAVTRDGARCIVEVPLGNRTIQSRGVARASGPHEALSAGHRARGERALGSGAVGPPLRRRQRDPGPAGDHPRHRRRAGVAGAGIGPRPLASQRGPRGVRGARAHPGICWTPVAASRRRWPTSGGRQSSRPTRRCRPATMPSRSISWRRTSPAAGDRWESTGPRFWPSDSTTPGAARCST